MQTIYKGREIRNVYSPTGYPSRLRSGFYQVFPVYTLLGDILTLHRCPKTDAKEPGEYVEAFKNSRGILRLRPVQP